MTHRRAEASTIDRKAARAQFALYLTQARPEMLAKVTVDELARRFRVPRRELEQGLERARA